MTQVEKKLVIKDLCGRLPYGVIVQVNDGLKGAYNSQLVQVFCDRISCSVSVCNPLKECICIDSVKPYLRPLSSMTEEESTELSNIISEWFDKELFYLTEEPFLEYALSKINYSISPLLFDWLNSHHFDYRGLIPKGLAISTNVYNPYKN